MRALITDSYRTLNIRLHKRRERYGSNGHKWASRVHEYVQEHDCKTLLDYGCGKGTLTTHLPEIPSQGYDPAVAEFDVVPVPADFVACLDVLEHVEEELLGNVLAHIASLTKKRALFAISLRKANKMLADGRNAHLIVMPALWWRRRLEYYFMVTPIQPRKGHTRDIEFAAMCKPKPSLNMLPSISANQRNGARRLVLRPL
jgi:hypothetical protein